ncbi:MAG: hypothetical protein D6712_11355, partial [Chloroflexi bacterium]
MVAEENHRPQFSDENRTTHPKKGEHGSIEDNRNPEEVLKEDYLHQDNHSPDEALKEIRQNMRRIAQEYADGAISRAQFNALYAHYSEKRT